MTKETKPPEKQTGLALLREPFPPHQISKLPKESRAQIDERKSDRTKVVWNCEVCGGTHHKNAVHLDYVGHAALTDRLLDCDPAWTWEPFAISADGLPLMDRTGGLWIKLTVCGVTRNGYGDADGKTGGNAVKEAIGDALRNAAMRFGAALDLWHKGDLHADPEAEEADEPAKEAPAKPGTKANSRDLYDTLVKGLRKCRSSHQLRQWAEAFKDDIKKLPADWAAEIREEYKAELNAHLDHETAESKPMLTNNPPSAAELFADEIASLKERIASFPPITDANAGEARDLIGLAKKLAKDIDAKRDEEKRPHLEAGRAIDATYKPLKEAADAAPAPLSKALMDHINEQKRLAAEAAEKARKAAEEEARRAAVLADDPLIGEEAVDAARLAEQRAEVAAASVKVAATVKGSEGFRAAGVVKSYRAKVIDYAALVLHYGHHPDVQAAAEKLANAAIRAAKGSITIPGVEVETIESLR